MDAETRPRASRVVPSLASANQLDLAGELERVNGAPSLHLDIEDGVFVPTITFGARTLHQVAARWRGSIDVHLMVAEPLRWLDEVAAAGCSHVAMHVEALSYPRLALARARSLALAPGLAINPATDASAVLPYLDAVDYVLVMTAEPDGEGQSFRMSTLSKIDLLNAHRPADVEIWADGGIGHDEHVLLTEHGVDAVVAGRWVFDDPAERPVALATLDDAGNGRA